jgi:hypothetical protein
MSSKKKNRKCKSLNQIKQERAEHKRNFFRRIENICALVDGQKYYAMIPKEELEKIYRRRGLPPTLISAPGCNVQESVLKEIRFGISVLVRNFEVPIDEEGHKISVLELITIGIIFFNYLTNLQENEYTNAAEVKKLLRSYRPFEKIFDDTYWELYVCMLIIAYDQSSLDGKIYWLKHEIEVSERHTFGLENLIRVSFNTPEQISVCIDNKKRPTFRVCWWKTGCGLKYYFVSYKELGINGGSPDSTMDIYIQSHALQRLKERLDCLNPVFMNIHLTSSLENIKMHKNEDGVYFIEYLLNEIKIGYLVADIRDCKLVIRTFLFITQNGTPEGNKLSELYGLAKIDKSYIALDKLSTYVLTDLCINNNLRAMFDQAGCQYLLDIYTDNKIKSYCRIEKNHSMAEDIVKFFGFDRNESINGFAANHKNFINMYNTSTR